MSGQFAAALSMHPVPSHAVGEAAGEILERFTAEDPDLVVCFATPHFAGALDDMVHALRNLLTPRTLVGVTMGGVAGGATEVEETPGFAVFAARFAGARLTPVALRQATTADGAAIVGWPDDVGDASTLVLLGDPFSFPIDAFLRRLDDDRPDLAVVGGIASAAQRPGGNRLVLDDAVLDAGAVGVFLEGAEVRTVVSQGCRPVGSPFVVTNAHGNTVVELAGRPPLVRLRELAESVSDEERELLQAGLHLGLVVDEHRAEFGRGDFLVRNVVGADRETGALSVGDLVHVGQTVQFHVRDAPSADEDLRAMLGGVTAEAALLFTCNGRGHRLFGVPDHDAGLINELVGPIPLAGGFCAGEIGPVGPRSFLHGFTASIAFFS